MDTDLSQQLEQLKREHAEATKRFENARAAIYAEQHARDELRSLEASKQFAADLDAWRAQQGYLNMEQYCEKYGLHWREIETGIKQSILTGYLPPPRFFNHSHAPVGVHFFEDSPPTDEQRRMMREQTLFSKGDAALWLGISEYQFDKRRKKVGLVHIEKTSTSSGYLANLYRLSDIDKLREV